MSGIKPKTQEIVHEVNLDIQNSEYLKFFFFFLFIVWIYKYAGA